MKIIVKNNPADLGKEAGSEAAQVIRAAIKNNGFANIILATGTSQFETLNQLTQEDVDWKQVKIQQGDLDPRFGRDMGAPGVGQIEGGSTATPQNYAPHRNVGAAARMMMVSAAAAGRMPEPITAMAARKPSKLNEVNFIAFPQSQLRCRKPFRRAAQAVARHQSRAAAASPTSRMSPVPAASGES